jgi:hypothetical protein
MVFCGIGVSGVKLPTILAKFWLHDTQRDMILKPFNAAHQDGSGRKWASIANVQMVSS